MTSAENEIYRKARKRVKKKKEFYQHLGVYTAVSVFLMIINFLTSGGDLWFHWAIIPWGLAVMIHYFDVFGLPGGANSEEWEEEELAREIERQRRLHEDVAEPLEEPEEELKLKEFKKLREEWDDKDFV